MSNQELIDGRVETHNDIHWVYRLPDGRKLSFGRYREVLTNGILVPEGILYEEDALEALRLSLEQKN